ncbi:hypothetical protein DVA67_030830 [Solirubrobacter sp. CPCC 204708]|uniref:Uncharacterized protein n=1 Tax=Solirubrobacter deserti TaxID=2282478 RepID=A0ABT4RLG0_9ACTN|nr:hypothetical protein [Solirubrobacter deserti]MBE2320399.1 hypothetical protein [Solirubrobacter deserti]MDA0139406.1 hypothetical protein [Solirubrobacter deserti]
MNLNEAAMQMRRLVLDGDVPLTPEGPEAALYTGPGNGAQIAWRAFRAVAVQPAFDPIVQWGEMQAVSAGGFMFEAKFAAATPARNADPALPEHYELLFTRQFYISDIGDMLGLHLTIRVDASDELRALSASIFGENAPSSDPNDEAAFIAGAEAWVAQVEASRAFSVPMSRHPATDFMFGLDAIG